jgi:hypothetical protein
MISASWRNEACCEKECEERGKRKEKGWASGGGGGVWWSNRVCKGGARTQLLDRPRRVLVALVLGGNVDKVDLTELPRSQHLDDLDLGPVLHYLLQRG